MQAKHTRRKFAKFATQAKLNKCFLAASLVWLESETTTFEWL